jgi:hypothetical protein
MVIDSSQNRSGQGRLFLAALAALVLLLAGTLLYPDTMTNAGLRLGQLRISPLGVLMVLALPPVAFYVWNSRHQLSFQMLDFLLLTGLAFLTIRGAAAAVTANGLLLVVAYTAYALLSYYGMAAVGQKSSAVRVIFRTMACLAVVIAAYAMVEFLLDRNIIFDDLIRDKVIFRASSLHRTGSTLGQPIVLGNIMVQLAPFLVYFFLKSRNVGARIWWGATILTATMALWVSYAKGSMAAALILVAAVAVWIGWKKAAYKKTFAILLAAGLICILSLGAIFYRSADYNLFSPERREESFTLRWYFWEKVPGAVASQPLIGSGLWQGVPGFEGEPHAIDNLYLGTLVEQGLIGSVLLGGALVLIGRQVWRLIAAGGRIAILALTLAVSMAALLLASITSNPLFIWPTMVVFWMEAGLIRALYEKKAAAVPSGAGVRPA